MNNCTDYYELISAYADGETNEDDRKLVIGHIAGCESCAARLEAYRDISQTVNRARKPAHPALREGVMTKIHSGDTDKAMRSSRMRIVLFRYLPIAACLAVMLLTLPRHYSGCTSPAQHYLSGVSDNLNMAIRPEESAVLSDSADHDVGDGGAQSAGGYGMHLETQTDIDEWGVSNNESTNGSADEPAPEGNPPGSMRGAVEPDEDKENDPSTQYESTVPPPATETPSDDTGSMADNEEAQDATTDEPAPSVAEDDDAGRFPMEEESTDMYSGEGSFYAYIAIYGNLPDFLIALGLDWQDGDSGMFAYVTRETAINIINSDSDGSYQVRYGDENAQLALIHVYNG